MYCGGPLNDIVHLLGLCVAGAVRREHFPRIFGQYYARLKERLAGTEHALKCTHEQMWNYYEVNSR